MAKKREVVRKYNMADADLKQTADNILQLTSRDYSEFSDFGFNATKKTALETAIINFTNYPTDEQLEGQKVNATQLKNEKRDALEQKMRAFLVKVRYAFANSKGRVLEFGHQDVSSQTDSQLVRTATLAADAASRYLGDLTGEGVTLAEIQLIKGLKDDLDTALDEQARAISARDASTEERVELGNSLYELISKYAEIGKAIWSDINQAKYEDYIIYASPNIHNTTNNNTSATPPDNPDTTV